MDDLKAIWAKNPPAEIDFPEGLRRVRMQKLNSSARKLRFRLCLEAAAVLLFFVAVCYAWQNGMVYKSRTVLWMLALTAISVLPVFWRLGRAIFGLARPDFSKNIVENLRAAVANLRRELKIYLWSLYAFSAVMAVLLMVDPFSFLKKIFFIAVLLVNTFLGKFWVRMLYGRELERLERELDGWENG